jgi:hypothetical protein
MLQARPGQVSQLQQSKYSLRQCILEVCGKEVQRNIFGPNKDEVAEETEGKKYIKMEHDTSPRTTILSKHMLQVGRLASSDDP